MKPFREFISSHFKSLNRTLFVWPIILFVITCGLTATIEKRNLDLALEQQMSAIMLFYENFSEISTATGTSPLSFYLKKKEQYYSPTTGAKAQAPLTQESTSRYLVLKSKPNPAGEELIIIGDLFSFYAHHAKNLAIYLPIIFIVYLASFLLFSDLNHFWINRYTALFDLVQNAERANFSKLIKPIPHDYLKGLLFALNRSVISLNELYVSLNGWIQELKTLNLSSQINHKVEHIDQKIHEKYQFEGEKIHLSFFEIAISPSYFMLFLLSFSEGLFVPFFNFYFVQNIKSSFLDYLLILLTIFFVFSLYSLFQRSQNRTMIFISVCLFVSILGKVILGYEMINDQEVIISYAVSVIAQILAVGFYLFYMFKPFAVKKISTYLGTGIVSGLLTGWIFQTNDLAIHALLYAIYCTYLAVLYFFFIPQEKKS